MSDEASSHFGAPLVPDDGLSEEVDVDLDDMNNDSPRPDLFQPAVDAQRAAAADAAKAEEAAEAAQAATAKAAASQPPPSQDVGHRASEPAKKAARRMSLRVPDDEVVRPQSTFTRTGETRVFRPEELEAEARASASSRPPPAPAVAVSASEPPRPRAHSASNEVGKRAEPASEVTKAATAITPGAPGAPFGPGGPGEPGAPGEARPRLASISGETASVVGLPPPPRPRAPSISEVSAAPRPAARSVSSEGAPPTSVVQLAAAERPLRNDARYDARNDADSNAHPPSGHGKAASVDTNANVQANAQAAAAKPAEESEAGEIKPGRIISVYPTPSMAEGDGEDIPTDIPTLTDLLAVRESLDVIPVAIDSVRDSDGIPIVLDIEPFELKTSPRKTEPAPPPEPVVKIASMRMPATTIPDDGGIDIPVDEDSDPPEDAAGEDEVGTDDLLSIESAPQMPPISTRTPQSNGAANGAGDVARAPPTGTPSETNVAGRAAHTPPGGIKVPGAAAAAATTPLSSTAINPPHSQGSPTPLTSPLAPVERVEPIDAPETPRSAARQPRVIVPPHASPLAPHPMSDAAAAARKKQRPWWEELFNDDFIRTMSKITDEQIAREVDFIEDSLGVARGAMILDMACGTGRHSIELTRRGYRVVGLDLSLAMLAKAAEEAQERNQKLNFVQGDMREMTFDDMFDGIFCWNTSFGFFEEDRNAQVIQRVHRALRKGGQFVLDVMNRDFALQQQPSLVWFEGDGCICMDEMHIDWITSRMRVKRTMMMDDGRSREIEYSMRIYSLHELGKMLHDHGFRVAEVSGRTSTPGVFFGAESPNVLVLAEKR